MTIEEIGNELEIYTTNCINYGQYSLSYSAEKEIASFVMRSQRLKLLETIKQYKEQKE